MPSTPIRRPIPALAALIALLLLTSLVWWRVLHRGGHGDTASACPTEAPVATLPAPSTITVVVLNATDRTGIAARARTTLVTDGFVIPRLAANDRPKVRIHGVAEIRFGPAGRKGATLLRYYFPGARMVRIHSKGASVVVSLGEKYHAVASPSAVAAALRRKQIVLTTTRPGRPVPSGSPTC